jgi:hypothetical protein
MGVKNGSKKVVASALCGVAGMAWYMVWYHGIAFYSFKYMYM